MRYSRLIILLFSHMMVVLTANAQYGPYVDSLFLVLDTEDLDSNKYKVYQNITSELEYIDRSAAIEPLAEQFKLATALNDDKKVATTAALTGRNYLYLGNTDSARTYLLVAQEKYESLSDLWNLNENMNNLALLYQRTNRYEKAVELYEQTIVYSDSLGDYAGELIANVNLMSLFMDLNDYETAIDYYNDLHVFIEDVDKDIGTEEAEISQYLAPVYLNGGLSFQEEGMLDSAMLVFEKGIESLEFIQDDYNKSYWKGYLDHGIGDVLFDQSQLDSLLDKSRNINRALYYYETALNGFLPLDLKREIVFSSISKGKVLNELGQTNEAKKLLLEGLEGAQEISFAEQIKEAYEHLAKNEKLSGNYKKAYEYLELFGQLKEDIQNDNRQKFISASKVKQDTQKKEAENKRLIIENELKAQQQRVQQVLFLGGILALLGIAYVVFSRFRLAKQREKALFEQNVNQAMSRFVPMDFIRAIGKDKIIDVELGDQIEKEVTVVFTDIRSFTAISEGMTPKENFAFVKEYAERMGPIIASNGGFISQYLGDGIMAIFQNSPSDALNACIEMQENIREYNLILKDRGIQPIVVGMGMHTGSLIMGIIGDEKRRDATLISDTVNTAARIESTTKTLGASILISEEAMHKLERPNAFVLTERGEVTVKGKKLPIVVYQCEESLNH